MIKSKNYPASIAIIALFSCLAVFSACKKYEEGPRMSLRSKSARVANNWKLDKVLLNGIDEPFEDEDIFYSLTKEGATTVTYVDKSTGDSESEAGTWAFKSDKEVIEIVSPSGVETWTIVRLKDDELWLSTTLLFFKIEYRFIPK